MAKEARKLTMAMVMMLGTAATAAAREPEQTIVLDVQDHCRIPQVTLEAAQKTVSAI